MDVSSVLQRRCTRPHSPLVLSNVFSARDGKPLYRPWRIIIRYSVTATTPAGKSAHAVKSGRSARARCVAANLDRSRAVSIVNAAQLAYVKRWIRENRPDLESTPVLSAAAPSAPVTVEAPSGARALVHAAGLHGLRKLHPDPEDLVTCAGTGH